MSILKEEILYNVLNEKLIPIIGNDLFKVIVSEIISDRDEIAGCNTLANIEDFLVNKLKQHYHITSNEGDLLKLVFKIRESQSIETIKSSIHFILNSIDSTQVYIDPIKNLIETRKFPILFNATISNIFSQAAANYHSDYITQLNFSIPPNSLLHFNRNNYFPILINIFGTANNSNFAIGENEILDYLFLFNSQDELGEILFDLITEKHILILGLTLPGWILKVFVKLILKYRSDPGQQVIIITRDIYYDVQLRDYLNLCGVRYYPVSALGFPSLLSFISDFSEQVKLSSANTDIRYNESVFISYSRKDIVFVNKLKAAFKRMGVAVWYDIESLQSGDSFNKVIQDAISRKCNFFLPVISQNSIKDPYAFVYDQEWMTASVIRRLKEINPDKSFIKPIIIDNTDSQDVKIPSEFRELHMEKITYPEDIDTYINRFIKHNKLTLVNQNQK